MENWTRTGRNTERYWRFAYLLSWNSSSPPAREKENKMWNDSLTICREWPQINFTFDPWPPQGYRKAPTITASKSEDMRHVASKFKRPSAIHPFYKLTDKKCFFMWETVLWRPAECLQPASTFQALIWPLKVNMSEVKPKKMVHAWHQFDDLRANEVVWVQKSSKCWSHGFLSIRSFNYTRASRQRSYSAIDTHPALVLYFRATVPCVYEKWTEHSTRPITFSKEQIKSYLQIQETELQYI